MRIFLLLAFFGAFGVFYSGSYAHETQEKLLSQYIKSDLRFGDLYVDVTNKKITALQKKDDVMEERVSEFETSITEKLSDIRGRFDLLSSLIIAMLTAILVKWVNDRNTAKKEAQYESRDKRGS